MNRLEELGYVEQVPTKDKREKKTQLTELGKKVYMDVRVVINQYEEDILKGISEQEQIEAIRIMGVIRNNITK
jgi:DNA-binding MarR family transcriptional regulator